MSFFSLAFAYLFGSKLSTRASQVRIKPIRIDAYPELLLYHDVIIRPKPLPIRTHFLPLRTRVYAGPLDHIAIAQTHAFYEELDTIPAAAVDKKSEFESGHWYLIHPMYPQEAMALRTRVLQEIEAWIEKWASEEIYVGEHKQVKAFRNKRAETLAQVKKELGRRVDRDKGGGEEGYLGSWAQVDHVTAFECHGETNYRDVREQKKNSGYQRPEIRSSLSESSKAEADALARQMVENIWDAEYDFVR